MLFETMKFEPRDMNRIQPFCDRLAKAWEKLTDWRFGQLMVNLMRDYEEMECAICHRKESSKTRCVNGHYICNECHMAGLDTIIGLCLKSTSRNPVEIIESMMALPFCHMHGPEHHVMVGAALLTAYKNAGGALDLGKALVEMMNRGKSVPGGACGFWGACGAGISAGMFVSIISGSTPLAQEPFALLPIHKHLQCRDVDAQLR